MSAVGLGSLEAVNASVKQRLTLYTTQEVTEHLVDTLNPSASVCCITSQPVTDAVFSPVLELMNDPDPLVDGGRRGPIPPPSCDFAHSRLVRMDFLHAPRLRTGARPLSVVQQVPISR